MKIQPTKLPGVKLITPTIFRDSRGEYIQTFDSHEYFDSGVDARFVQDDLSVSKRGVLRGIHGDDETWKLVSCVHGRFFLAVVDLNTDPKRYGKWQGFYLDDVKRQQVLIPPSFGNGHYVLSETCIFSYKQSTHYKDVTQVSYRYDDKFFKIKWPLKGEPLLSKRDKFGEHTWTLRPKLRP